jgi:hypothetical protein
VTRKDRFLLFIDRSALISRFINGVSERRQFVFLLGSGTSAAEGPGKPGVPMASEILQKVRHRTKDPGINDYQSGFERIQSDFGADEANRIIRNCVLAAVSGSTDLHGASPVEELEALEDDPSAWHHPTALRALTALIAMHPSGVDPISPDRRRLGLGTEPDELAWRAELQA